MNYRNENQDYQNVKQPDAKDPKYFIEEESKKLLFFRPFLMIYFLQASANGKRPLLQNT